MPTRLDDAEVNRRLAALPAWRRQGDALELDFECSSYSSACALVVQVAIAAEKLEHHPDLSWRYRKLSFHLTTHDAGGLSALDFELAHQIDELSRGK
jgi:4a-hydroxytetrahydrobiopterin dehydratase